MIARERLDPLLLLAAEAEGVLVRHGVAARWSAEGLLLDGRRQDAALVVAADGLGSGIARAAGLAASAANRRFGFACDVVRGGGNAEWPERGIAMLVGPGGYLGVVRDGDRLHLAACCPSRRAMPSEPRACIAWFAARHAGLRAALGDEWPLRVEALCAAGPMPWRTTARCTGPIALVGDAAGYVEPFTGEGIAWAIASARLLGETATRPGRWEASERAAYELAWQRGLAGPHRRCAIVAGLVARPRLVAAIGSIARCAPGLGRRAARALVPR